MQLKFKTNIPKITLTALRSLHDNQSLFDFDHPVYEEIFILNESAHIYRKREGDNHRARQMVVVTQQNAANGNLPDYTFQMLFSLKIKKQDDKIQYYIDRPETLPEESDRSIEKLQLLPFICLNNHGRINEIKTHRISQGNILKFGKIFLKIIQTNSKVIQLPNIIQSHQQLQLSLEADLEGTNKTCRICLSEGCEGDELISPCDCKGSCKYVHLSCLQTWIQSKVVKHENSLVSSYTLAKFQCQLCKKSLPNTIRINDKTHHLVQFRKPDGPYLTLQKIQQNSKDKIIFILTPNKQSLTIGRGFNTDLRINDISISRLHASIQYQNNNFYLTDKGSKFGSLILLQQKVQIPKVMCLQLGRSIYKMQIMQDTLG